MKPTAHYDATSAKSFQHPAVAYLILVRPMLRITLLITCSVVLAGRLLAQEMANDTVESSQGQKYSAGAYKAGRSEAMNDIKANKLIIEVSGLPAPWSGEYAKFLADKYHIEMKTVAGCIVDSKIVGHERGYNEISVAEIERRYGHGVLEKSAEDVQKKWQQMHKN
jgi:hypothetical protein